MNILTKRMVIPLVWLCGILSGGTATADETTYHWQPVYTPHWWGDFNPPPSTITLDGYNPVYFDESADYGTFFPDSQIINYLVFGTISITPRVAVENYWSLDASLDVNPETGLLFGSLRSDNSETTLDMSSDSSGLWTINSLSSDAYFVGACYDTPCYGATGRWVSDFGYSVPEPSEIPIFALGLFLITGLGLARRFSATT